MAASSMLAVAPALARRAPGAMVPDTVPTPAPDASATPSAGWQPPVAGGPSPTHSGDRYRPLHSALRSGPTRFGPVAGGGQVPVHDDHAAHTATAALGAHGLTWQGHVFLGGNLGRRGFPARDEIVRHETVHARQQSTPGVPQPVGHLERQADRRTGAIGAADPDRPLGAWWWIPPALAGLYTLLRPKVANAPGPGDPTYASPSDLQIAGEAFALFGLPPVVGAAIKGAGYSAVGVWAGSGAVGSVGYRAVGDVARGEFSGVDAYVVDAGTGAFLGVVVGGTFHVAGRLPVVRRFGDWWRRGAENDEAWRAMSLKDKYYYEMGQKTVPDEVFARYSNLSAVERGKALTAEFGHLRTMLKPEAKFFTGATMGTGPTPAARWGLLRMAGLGTGVLGGALHDPWVDPFMIDAMSGASGHVSGTSSLSPGSLSPGSLSPGSGTCPGGCHTPTDAQAGMFGSGAQSPPVILVRPAAAAPSLFDRDDVGDFPLPRGDTFMG